MTDVSVIIPCYNRVNTISLSIESILRQDYSGSLEIIISDDGSTDGTLELLESKYSNKVILLKKTNPKIQGAAGARNRGLRIATGRYICFLDSDDVYNKDFIRTMTHELETNLDLGYVFCRVDMSTLNTENGNKSVRAWTRQNMSVLDIKYHVLHRSHCICTISIMCRKNVVDSVGEFDTNLTVGEDSDMWIRMSEYSNGTFLDYIGAVYNIDGYSNNQLTKNVKEGKGKDARQVYLNALNRYQINASNDKMRLLLIYRGIYFSELRAIKSRVVRYLLVLIKLFFKMPQTTLHYLLLRNKVSSS